MPADFEVFVQCSVTPLHMSERAAAPQIVRRFELIKKRVRFFCLLFFCLYSARRLSYGITLLILRKNITQMKQKHKNCL